MNIARHIPKPEQWFANRKLMTKLIFAYIICGLIPMLTMMVYYYYSTSSMLRSSSYADLRQDATVMSNSLTTFLQPYETILDNLKNDRNLNTLLGLDYTEMSYSDLAWYMNNTLDEMTVMYPSISWIRFYSTNDTLPGDGYYFHSLDELESTIYGDLYENQRSIVISMFSENDDSEIVLASRMNYYASDVYETYIVLGISADLVSDQFYYDTEARNSYLLNRDGEILLSSQEIDINEDNDFETIVPGWRDLSSDAIYEGLGERGHLIGIKVELTGGLCLFLTIDDGLIYLKARSVPLRMLAIFAIFSLCLLIPVLIYSRRMHRQLRGILEATERIGAGDFEWEIPVTTKDEFGQIEEAVNRMNHQIEGLIRDNYQKALEVQISDLNLLQEQINPHFLYNALAVINSMALREGARQTILCIKYLADFYRISLNKGRQIVTVGEEVDLLKNYMKIQLIRFEDIISIDYDISPVVENMYTIKLLLQPLVENSIHHARDEEVFLHITVRSYRERDRVCFDVIDDGMGMDPETLDKLRQKLLRQEDGFGLKNVDKRIKLNYGSEYGASIFSEQGKGTRIHLEIPVVEVRG